MPSYLLMRVFWVSDLRIQCNRRWILGCMDWLQRRCGVEVSSSDPVNLESRGLQLYRHRLYPRAQAGECLFSQSIPEGLFHCWFMAKLYCKDKWGRCMQKYEVQKKQDFLGEWKSFTAVKEHAHRKAIAAWRTTKHPVTGESHSHRVLLFLSC